MADQSKASTTQRVDLVSPAGCPYGSQNFQNQSLLAEMPALPVPSGRVRAPMPPASSLSQTYGYGEGFAPPHGLGLQSHGPARTCSTITTRGSTIVAVSTQPQNVEVSLAGGSTDQDTMTQGREYHQVFSTTTDAEWSGFTRCMAYLICIFFGCCFYLLLLPCICLWSVCPRRVRDFCTRCTALPFVGIYFCSASCCPNALLALFATLCPCASQHVRTCQECGRSFASPLLRAALFACEPRACVALCRTSAVDTDDPDALECPFCRHNEYE